MKKIRRKRIKKVFLYIIVLALIGVFIYYKYLKKDFNIKTNYSDETVKLLKEKNLNDIIKKDYSKVLDEIIKNNMFNIDFTEEYLKINYIDKTDFIEKVNKYLQIGYTGEDINNIFKLSDINQKKLLDLKKIDFNKYIEIKNFDVNKIDRYNDYSKNNNYELKDIVTYVNINLDKEYYTDTIESTEPNSLLVLVNKYNCLPNNYKPSDLVYVDGAYGNKVPFRSILKESFIKLQEAAKEEININLMPTTAFRDQAFQKTLYDKYVSTDGKKEADTYSARPGYSEHQTGLAIDLKNMALSNGRLTEDNFNWLSNNAYKYGFIIRFPKDKEFITGYQFENWHIRYVGDENAKIIHENNLTLEEYIDLYITEY